MKAKPFQISALKDQILNQFAGVLLFGTDTARVADLAKIIKKMIHPQEDPFSLLSLSSHQLKSAPFLITDEANTPSLSASRRLILMKDGGNLSLEAFCDFIDHRRTDAFLLITADNLPKNNALRLEAESLPNFLTIACYPPDEIELNKIIFDEAQKQGFTISPQAIEYMIQNTNANLLILKNELEKLALYNSEKKPVSLEMIQNLMGLGNVSIDRFIQAVSNKKTAHALFYFTLLINQGEQCVSLCRLLNRSLDLLVMGKNLLQTGKNPMQVADSLLKASQFRLKRPFQEQLRLWSVPQLLKAKRLLLEGEIQMKLGNLPPELIFKKVLLTLSGNPK